MNMSEKINFEGEFQQFNPTEKKPRSIVRNILVIVLYFILTEVLAIVASISFSGVKSFLVTYSSEEIIASDCQEKLNVIGVASSFSENSAYVLYEYHNFAIIIHKDNELNHLNDAELSLFFDKILAGEKIDIYMIEYASNIKYLLTTNEAMYQEIAPLEDFSPLFLNITNLVIFILTAIPVVILLKSDWILDLKFYKENKRQSTFRYLNGFLITIAATIAIGLLTELLTSILHLNVPISDNQASINEMAQGGLGLFIMIISACIVAPILEELVFRKAIFNLIKNAKLAILLSTIIFGAIHLISEIMSGNWISLLINSISYFGMGFVLAYVYHKNKKNIIINIMVHATYNLVGLLLPLIFSLLPF